MEKMLKDRVAIITGSGRGIGKSAAMMFAQEGAKVVVSDIDPEPAEETVSEIIAAGGEAIAYPGDATAEGFADGIVKSAVDTWGGLHILVNNAGFTWDGVVHKMSDKMWDAILDIHLKAPFRIIRAAAPYFRDAAKNEMAEGKSIARKIVNISSISGTRGNAGQANYASAKSGICGLTKSISKEWGRFNVQVNAAAYGLVETRLTASQEESDQISVAGEKVTLGLPGDKEALTKRMHAAIPMGRGGTPEEAAGVILFLASPLSDYVSGQVIEMTGGK